MRLVFLRLQREEISTIIKTHILKENGDSR